MEVLILAKEEYEGIISTLNSILKRIDELSIGGSPQKTLTNKEVCQMLHISNRTLQNYRDSGEIEFSQIGRKIFYNQTSIHQFLKRNKI